MLFCSLGGVVSSFPAHRTNIINTFYSACQWETVYIFFVISIKFFWMYFRHEELLKKTFSSRNMTKTHTTRTRLDRVFSGDMGRLIFLVQIYFRNTDHIEKSHHCKYDLERARTQHLEHREKKKKKKKELKVISRNEPFLN